MKLERLPPVSFVKVINLTSQSAIIQNTGDTTVCGYNPKYLDDKVRMWKRLAGIIQYMQNKTNNISLPASRL